MKDFNIPEYLLSLDQVIIDNEIDPKLTVYKTKVGNEQKILQF